jgi:hypothetical protein
MQSGAISSSRESYACFQITVDNISNEVGPVKNVSSSFLLFLSTPLQWRKGVLSMD